MKDENDAVTIDAFASGCDFTRSALVKGSHYQPSAQQRVTGKRHKGSKTPDSQRPNWRTPDFIYNWLNMVYGPFEVDLAACRESTKCELYFCEEENSLLQDWRQFGRAFLNPPYNLPGPWVIKAAKEGPEVLAMILPDDNSTIWYRNAALAARDIINVISNGKNGGRVAFVDPVTGKPSRENNKGTVIFIFGNQRKSGPRTLYISQDDMISALEAEDGKL